MSEGGDVGELLGTLKQKRHHFLRPGLQGAVATGGKMNVIFWYGAEAGISKPRRIF